MQSNVAPFFASISEASFSAVSKPVVASKYVCYRIFQGLQDVHTFAPVYIISASLRQNSFYANRVFSLSLVKIVVLQTVVVLKTI